jgi:hypothetical protein
MQINGGAKAWRDQATRAVQSRGSLRTFSKGQILSVDGIRGPREVPRTMPVILDAHRFRPLQILARDLAGNQYT